MLKLSSFLNVEYIYHFGSDDPWKKIMGDASSNIIRLSQDESALNILPSNVLSLKLENLDAGTQRLVANYGFTEFLYHHPYTSQAKQEFVRFSRNTYTKDDVRLNQICDFEKQHRSEMALWWYTKDSFPFHILNKTLRSYDLSSMFKIRYYISDLYSELDLLYHLQLKSQLLSCISRLYRGKVIQREEFDDLKKSIGKYAVVNSFVSYSVDKKVALAYVDRGIPESTGNVSVVFCIENNATKDFSKPIAFIKEYSEKPDEYEVLLSSGIIFKIVSIDRLDENLWEIHLFRGTEEQQFGEEFYKHFWLPDGFLNMPVDIESIFKTINDGQYFKELKNVLPTNFRTTNSIPSTQRHIARFKSRVFPDSKCELDDPNMPHSPDMVILFVEE
ncbi:unnamed protein product [Rotaria sp. Silwood2]|nr:unnamed protein product [Rotaria sp. Silwood2]CAF4162247.1 unnamed protein product [Rotaria sp. Silwood2]